MASESAPTQPALQVWDLINFSDTITFLAPDIEIAAYCTYALGRGQLGSEEVGGERKCPIFLLGGAAEWFEETFNEPAQSFFDRLKDARRDEIAACFASFLYASPSERRALDELRTRMTADEWSAYRAQHQNEQRTSMSNICAAADQMAEHYAKPGAASPTKEA